MRKECVGTGRSVEEAIDAACAQLGYSRDEVQFEILNLQKKGFLGIGAQPARVRIFVDLPDPKPIAPAPVPAAPKPSKEPVTVPVVSADVPSESAPLAEPSAAEEKKVGEWSDAKAQAAVDYLTGVLVTMGLHDVKVTVREEKDNHAVLTLDGESLGVIIGRRGETLDALQYLTGLVANRTAGDYMRVTIDSGNYREKRARTLEALAHKLANTVVRTGKSTTLEPMNPYERRIIHTAVATVEGASSSSIGEEPNRRVVISPTDPSAARRPQKGGRSTRDSGGSRGGRRGDGQQSHSRRPSSYNGRNDRRPAGGDKPSTAPAASRSPKMDAEDKPLYGKIDL